MKRFAIFAVLPLLFAAGAATAQSSKSDKEFYKQQQTRANESRASNNASVNRSIQNQRYESSRPGNKR